MSANTLFSVTASGTPPMYYQWESGSGPPTVLSDTARITGSRFTGSNSASLYINRVIWTDTGSYRVRVWNMLGESRMDVSQRAALRITASSSPPLVIFHPTNQYAVENSTASFSASVVGTEPLGLQWRSGSVSLEEGARIHGVNSMSMWIENLQLTDTGSYWLRVSSPYGEAYSDPAWLIFT